MADNLQKTLTFNPNPDYFISYYFDIALGTFDSPVSYAYFKRVDYKWLIAKLKKEGYEKVSERQFFNTKNKKKNTFMDFSDDTNDNDELFYNSQTGLFICNLIEEESLKGKKRNKEEVTRRTKVCNTYVIYSLASRPKVLDIFLKEIDGNVLLQESKNTINFLIRRESGFDLKSVEIDFPAIDIELNYGSSFLPVYDSLIEFFNSDKVGLSMLHGKPGTGKSSLIKHLLGKIEKKVIYVSPHLVNQISDPSFLAFMLEQRDMVLVIEDAEEILMAREGDGNSVGVSNLLNLTDGILGSALKIQAICTFNTQIAKIDAALLRKGRLVVRHEFNSLSVTDSNNLLKHLKVKVVATEPMTLAEIYNTESKNYQDEPKKIIGFGK